MATVEIGREFKKTDYYQNKFLKDMEKLGKELAENGYYKLNKTGLIKFNVYKQKFQIVTEAEFKHIIHHSNIYQSDLIAGFYFSDAVNTIFKQLKQIKNIKAFNYYKITHNKEFQKEFQKDYEKIKNILEDDGLIFRED